MASYRSNALLNMSALSSGPAKATSRPFLLRKVQEGGPYDVRNRLQWMGPENAQAPDPDVHYDPATIAELLAMDPRAGLLILDPSYYCNLACSFCSLPIHSKTRVEWDRLRSLLKLLAQCGMKRAVITGGEPGILPGLSDMVRDLRDWGYDQVVLFTHGIWAKNADYMHEVLASGITDITMSIKAFDDASAERITRKPRVFSQQVSALRNLGDALANGRLSGLHINHVITSDTVPGLLKPEWLDHVPAGAALELCIVEPYEPHMLGQVPQASVALAALFTLLEACDERGIGYKIDGAPYCLLGKYSAFSGDRHWLGDRNLRVFIKPGPAGDYVLAHHGYQRILQYGYRSACEPCAARDGCMGLHKRYDESQWLLSPIGHGDI